MFIHSRFGLTRRPKESLTARFTRQYFDDPSTWRTTYWQGVQTAKCPLDLWIFQEIITETEPDLIIETGTHQGGSALFLASICDLLGKGEILTIDTIERPERPRHPRITYLLHEMGEETRHQRLFQRIITQVGPKARNPLQGHWLVKRVDRRGQMWVIDHPGLLYVMVLAGEEIPDLLQKLASEHPDTDPFLAEVNRYHRQEEARHLSFARSMLPEVWAKASWVDRFQIHHVAPAIIRQMFGFLVHPGVYETIGLDGWATWKAVQKLPERQGLLAEATRPVLDRAKAA